MRSVAVMESPVVVGAGFSNELEQVIAPVQAAFRQLLVEWGGPASGKQLAQLSGVGTTLCWRVYRVATAKDLAAEARNVPSPGYLKKLLEASGRAGISEEAIRAAHEAARGFHAFTKRVASDRVAFDSMLAGASSDETSEKLVLPQRRTAYRAMSHLGGVQTDLQFESLLVRRSEADEEGSAGKTDQLLLLTTQGIRQLRPDAKITLMKYHRNPSGMADGLQALGAIDEEALGRYGMPVLPEFSRMPFPQIERVALPSGFTLYNAVGREIGAKGTIDVTIARKMMATPLLTDVDGRRLHHFTYSHIRHPVATVIHEVLLHRASFPKAELQLMVHQYQEGDLTQEAARQAQQYAVEEKLERLGRADVVGLAEMPRYGELLRYGTKKMGWELSEFDVWRVKVAYPILNSAVRIWFYVD